MFEGTTRTTAGRGPMTPAAERLWFLQQLDPADASSNMAVVQRLRGPLDIGALERAVTAVVGRHEPLRTRFGVTADGRSYQEVLPPGPVALPVVDVSEAPVGEREARAVAVAADRVNRPFDLAAGPGFAPFVVRIAADD